MGIDTYVVEDFQENKNQKVRELQKYGKKVAMDGNAITISNLTSGVAECEDPAGVDEVEDRYYAALKATTNFEALVTSMVFTGADGQDLIFFGTP